MLVPTGNSLPLERPLLCSNVALPKLQSEVALGAFQLTMAPVLPTSELVVILLGQLKFKTASCSITVTVKRQLSVLLQMSDALYSTVDMPMGNSLLLLRPSDWIKVGLAFGQFEKVVGSVHDTMLDDAPIGALTIILLGQLIVKMVLPGIYGPPGVAGKLIQLDARALSRSALINCKVGPVPSGSTGQGN